MPTLEVPDPRYLAAAVGPTECHCSAEQLMVAAEHLMILAFGALPSLSSDFTNFFR